VAARLLLAVPGRRQIDVRRAAARLAKGDSSVLFASDVPDVSVCMNSISVRVRRAVRVVRPLPDPLLDDRVNLGEHLEDEVS